MFYNWSSTPTVPTDISKVCNASTFVLLRVSAISYWDTRTDRAKTLLRFSIIHGQNLEIMAAS